MNRDQLRTALRTYLVVDPDHVSGDVITTVRAAISGGVTMVQLRVKNRTDRETLELGQPLRSVCSQSGVPFIVNDRLDLAMALLADGIHLGVDDLPLELARQLTTPDFTIGYSPESDNQVQAAHERGADYLGIGPLFGTSTKMDAGTALGIDEFARRRAMTPLPVVAIGGINARNAPSAMASGADGVAVVSAILRAPDPRAAAQELATAIKG